MTYSTDIQSIFKTLGLVPAGDSPAGMEVRTPIDGSLLARLAVTTQALVDAAIERVHTRFLSWRELPAPKRGALVRAFERLPVGDPMAAATLVEPLIDERAFDAMQSALKQARQDGAQNHFGSREAVGSVPPTRSTTAAPCRWRRGSASRCSRGGPRVATACRIFMQSVACDWRGCGRLRTVGTCPTLVWTQHEQHSNLSQRR